MTPRPVKPPLPLLAAALAGLILACGEGTGTFTEKRESAFPVLDVYRAPGKGLVDVAYAANALWVADADRAGRIYRVDPDDGEVLSSAAPGYGPAGALCSDGSYLYVVAADTGDVHKHRLTARLEETASFTTGLANVRGIYADAGRFYVFDQDTQAFYEFDAEFNRGASHAVGPGAQWLRGAARFKNRTWSCDNRDGWINLHKTANWDVARKYCTPGQHPAGLAWDGAHLFLGDGGGRRIYKLDVSSAP